MLFGSTMVEVAIGVVFVYLLVSLLCSAFSELIEAFLQYRSSDLKYGIEKLLHNKNLADALLDHPLIKPLGEKPSYIPARTFSLALWNLATTEAGRRRVAQAAAKSAGDDKAAAKVPAPGAVDPAQITVADDVTDAVKGVQAAAADASETAAGVVQDLKVIKQLVSELPEDQFGNIKLSLLSLMDEAGDDINKARANIEGWYDDAMDRVSGWYKRRTHKMLIVIGLLAAALLNIDTINITKALLYNDTLRTSVADAAAIYVKEHPTPTPSPATSPTPTTTPTPTSTRPTPTTTPTRPTPTGTATPVATATPGATPAATPLASPTPTADASKQAEDALGKIRDVRGELDKLGLPIGWVLEPTEPKEDAFENPETKKTDEKKFSDAKAKYNKEKADYPSDPRRFPDRPYDWILKVLGIFITGLAVSQGAPFWFDLLNKFMVIRSTVKPREKSHDEGTKDKSTKQDGKDDAEGGNK
jgi:hypothetical protein